MITSRRHTTPTVLLATALAGLLLAAAVASASTVGARSGFAVDGKGRTLYTLSGETTKHLKCTSQACLGIWTPLTVSSRKAKLTAASGVKGRLGLLKRSGGRLQVTLGGKPLYRFSGDSAPGDTNGDGIRSFGGTWHAVTAGAAKAPPPSDPIPSPGYPSY
jgi:predicted lipoprotein with Yx(FWY)xxD motif